MQKTKAVKLRDAAELADKTGYVFVATADPGCKPHLGVAGKMRAAGENSVFISEWFCPQTVSNLRDNRNLSITVWDPVADHGYQLLGQLQAVRDLAVLDGYEPRIESKMTSPQTEKQLLVKVKTILNFTLAPHCDAPI